MNLVNNKKKLNTTFSVKNTKFFHRKQAFYQISKIEN